MNPAVTYGEHTIEYSLERRERATLEITVTPHGVVEVVAPVDAHIDAVEARVRRRARWILRQQRYFVQFLPRTPPREWVPGETHLYLGRQYRLRIGERAAQVRRVRLIRGFLLIDGCAFDDRDSIERVVRTWYRQHADVQFRRRLEACAARFPEASRPTPTSIRLRAMPARWGSMSPGGCLTLNPELVHAPVDAIDYVITHELCHMIEPHHGRAFFELLGRIMPDWEPRKQRLERALA
ncbi:M48 family metallopeptidase [Agromyces sp. ISL-38]|uniref:M48 family metallopeptidase n=1 Tax=Agromyces sp. ISL-38 TaxID=2819107 RepID=UPI001BE80115|nr:SprT family zinc-dependent metalloprotease [Agromyces sp. ISL-38]MBT2497572.1 M48 family metallopeptidase [Agromyces sp. ISL-38]